MILPSAHENNCKGILTKKKKNERGKIAIVFEIAKQVELGVQEAKIPQISENSLRKSLHHWNPQKIQELVGPGTLEVRAKMRLKTRRWKVCGREN